MRNSDSRDAFAIVARSTRRSMLMAIGLVGLAASLVPAQIDTRPPPSPAERLRTLGRASSAADAAERERVAIDIATFDAHAVPGLPDLLRLASDPVPTVRRAAIHGIRHVVDAVADDAAVTVLDANAASAASRAAVGAAVGDNASLFVAALAAALDRTNDEPEAADAVRILHWLGPTARPALLAITRRTTWPDFATRTAALEAIAAIDASGAALVPRLIPLIDDADDSKSKVAARLAAALGPKGSACAPALLRALARGRFTFERANTANVLVMALAAVGANPSSIVAAIEAIAPTATDAFGREAVVTVLLRADPTGRVSGPAIIRWYRSAASDVQRQIRIALGSEVSDELIRAPGLAEAIAEFLPEVADTAALARTRLKPDETWCDEFRTLNDWLTVLYRQGEAARVALPRLIALLDDRADPQLRLNLLTVVTHVDPSGAIVRPMLEAHANWGPTPKERLRALCKLATLNPVPEGVVARLAEALDADSGDDAPEVVDAILAARAGLRPAVDALLRAARRIRLDGDGRFCAILIAVAKAGADPRSLLEVLESRGQLFDRDWRRTLDDMIEDLPMTWAPTPSELARCLAASPTEADAAIILAWLHRWGAEAAVALPAVRRMLTAPSPKVRSRAARVVANLGILAVDAIPDLCRGIEVGEPSAIAARGRTERRSNRSAAKRGEDERQDRRTTEAQPRRPVRSAWTCTEPIDDHADRSDLATNPNPRQLARARRAAIRPVPAEAAVDLALRARRPRFSPHPCSPDAPPTSRRRITCRSPTATRPSRRRGSGSRSGTRFNWLARGHGTCRRNTLGYARVPIPGPGTPVRT